MQPCFAPVQPSAVSVQQAFGPHAPTHLLHPVLATLGNFEVSDLCSRHSGSQSNVQKLPLVSVDTVGTRIIADPEKCFQELISEKLLIYIAGWALFGINYRFQ